MHRSIHKFRILFLVMALMAVTSSFAATPPQTTFNNANKLYSQQKYSEAATAYQQLIDEGYQSAALYLNAGNAYYKANAMGKAIYSFEMARKLEPSNEAVTRNLSLANQKIGTNTQALPLLFFERWWMDLQLVHSANGWAIGAIVLAWVFGMGFTAYRFMPALKKLPLKIALYVAGILFTGYFAMAAWSYNNAQDHHIGIVMNAGAKAKAAPDGNSKDVFDLKEGSRLEVVDSTRDYCKIMLNDGKTGWVPAASIKTL